MKYNPKQSAAKCLILWRCYTNEDWYVLNKIGHEEKVNTNRQAWTLMSPHLCQENIENMYIDRWQGRIDILQTDSIKADF